MSGERVWPERDEDDPIVEVVGTAIADWWSGDFYEAAKAALSTPEVASAFRDAARLRSLAATLGSRLNRGQSFTGAQVAAMLRDGEE